MGIGKFSLLLDTYVAVFMTKKSSSPGDFKYCYFYPVSPS